MYKRKCTWGERPICGRNVCGRFVGETSGYCPKDFICCFLLQVEWLQLTIVKNCWASILSMNSILGVIELIAFFEKKMNYWTGSFDKVTKILESGGWDQFQSKYTSGKEKFKTLLRNLSIQKYLRFSLLFDHWSYWIFENSFFCSPLFFIEVSYVFCYLVLILEIIMDFFV